MATPGTRSRTRNGILAALASALIAALAPAARAATAHVVQVGPASAGTALQIVLPLKADGPGLKSFAIAVSSPNSRLYGRYESVAALARRFGASASTRTRVIDYLRAQGARNVEVDATGLLAEATVTAGLAERMFRAPLARFHAVDGGARYIAPSSAPHVPPALRGLVEGVVGLNTKPLAKPAGLLRARLARARSARDLFAAHAAASQAPSALRRTGTPAGCAAGTSAGESGGDPATAGFTPNQYLTAYDFQPLLAAHISGQGERVALVEIDGYTPSDISTFAHCFGFPLPPVTPFGAGVTQALPPGGEATLDLEVLAAAAPGLRGIDVYETHSDPASVLKALVQPLEVAGRKPQVVSASLGLCEQDQRAATGTSGIDAAERLLELATATGVSYLASSGDDGSADCTDSNGVPLNELAVNYPASSWWVTGVGGTNLELTSANQIRRQIVWNDTIDQIAAAGGGLSNLFRRAFYQDGFVHTDSRAVPDVSMLSDLIPGYAIYCTVANECTNAANGLDPWVTVGGTSAATPLLAGGMALIDQVLHAHGRADLGLANPLLYQLGGSSARRDVFSDVTLIGNDVGPYLPSSGGQPLGCCTAKAGYDEASGWGSVDIAQFARKAINLVAYILGAVHLSLPSHQHPLARHAILATIACSRACYMGAFAKVQIGGKTFETDSDIFNRPSGGRRTIPLSFSSSQRHSLSSAHAKHTRIVATIYGVIVDPEGFVQRQTGGQKLVISS